MNKKNTLLLALIVGGLTYVGYSLFGGSMINTSTRQAVSSKNPQPTAPQQRPAPARRDIQVTAEQLQHEIINASPMPVEARQHAQLALSLRNQVLSSQRAKLLEEQRRAETEALKAQLEFHELQKSGTKTESEQEVVTTADGIPRAVIERALTDAPKEPLKADDPMRIENWRVVGIYRDAEGYVARITRGGSIERVKSGYTLRGDVEVVVLENEVRLKQGDREVSLYL